VRKGKYVRHRLGPPGPDVAVDATLRAAAVRGAPGPVRVEPQDLRPKIRHHRTPLVVCVVLDNSYSLHADKLVERAKGLTLRLLETATARGDRVALVAFKGGVPEATVALPPTASLSLAHRRLRRVPLSGRTPLADALRRTYLLLRNERIRNANAKPLAIVVTDGLPTAGLRPGSDPVRDALGQARALRRAHIATVVADAAATRPASCGAQLAAAARGIHLPLDGFDVSRLADALRRAE
jgi:magnesium chelatase subunit D